MLQVFFNQEITYPVVSATEKFIDNAWHLELNLSTDLSLYHILYDLKQEGALENLTLERDGVTVLKTNRYQYVFSVRKNYSDDWVSIILTSVDPQNEIYNYSDGLPQDSDSDNVE